MPRTVQFNTFVGFFLSPSLPTAHLFPSAVVSGSRKCAFLDPTDKVFSPALQTAFFKAVFPGPGGAAPEPGSSMKSLSESGGDDTRTVSMWESHLFSVIALTAVIHNAVNLLFLNSAIAF